MEIGGRWNEKNMEAKDINYYKIKLGRVVVDCSKEDMFKNVRTIEVEV